VRCESGGRDGIRTHDPGVANAVLSQLSYSPTFFDIIACGYPGLEVEALLEAGSL
jgi:hypothetical protein